MGMTFTPQGKDRAGDFRTFAAIYLLDGNELWVCAHGNQDRPRDFSMDVTIAYRKVIWVLRREREAKK